ncbi:secreted protein [gut metagenome]|uniref:Secreted protein n=1 Tax=gut metagenome TaxID=749906 RepID=J9C8N0_9ZZZZ
MPTGTSSAGMLGMVSRMVFSLSSMSFSSLSSSAILSPKARTAAICSEAS